VAVETNLKRGALHSAFQLKRIPLVCAQVTKRRVNLAPFEGQRGSLQFNTSKNTHHES
jgi:hypothetical protein